jgi:hypothetical protein
MFEYAQVAQAITINNLPAPAAATCTPATLIDARFAIYRDNVRVSLVEALADNFPTVVALLGQEFFGGMASAYVQDHKPQSPLLIEYGVSFPEFIEGFTHTAAHPYLADVARFDHAWLASWAAAEAETMTLRDLQTFSPEALADSRVELHPAAKMVISSWPVYSIWFAHQAAEPNLSQLQWQAQSAVIARPQADVQVTQLLDDQACFVHALVSGQTIAMAAERALVTDRAFDVGKTLGLLLNAGAIQRIYTNA